MKKTLLFLSTILVLIALTVSVSVFASEEDVIHSGTWGNLEWTLNDTTGELTISGDGAMNDFSSYSTDAWRAYKASIKNVVIDEGVTSIGGYAFYDCESLTSIAIQNGVTRIGKAAFCACPSLASINMPDSVISIDDFVFQRCTNLASVTISKSLTSVGNYVFEGCDKIQKVYVYDVEAWLNISFGEAFSRPNASKDVRLHILDDNNKDVTDLVIPENITNIRSGAFYGCCELISVTIPSNVTSIESKAFAHCSNLKSIAIPEGVSKIAPLTFYECSSMTNVKIPNSVTSIGERAFCGCTSLISVEIPDTLKDLGVGAFRDCDSLIDIKLPNSITVIRLELFKGCINLKNVEFGDIINIEDSSFADCISLEKITIPSSVTDIGENAFINCTNLKTVYVDSNTIASALDSFSACGHLIGNVEVILINEAIIDPAVFVTALFPYTESITYEGVDYVSYSLHAHELEDCPSTTTVHYTTNQAPTTTVADGKNEGGCSGFATGSVAIVALMTITGSAMLLKKKED